MASRIAPLVHSFQFCFYDFTTSSPTFVYFKNFERLLVDPVLIRSALNTMWFASISLGIVFLASLAIALLMNREFKGKSILKSILIIPWAIPPVTIGLVWLWMLNADFGLINAILFKMNLIPEYKSWLFEPLWAMFFLVVATAWKDFPFMTIIFMSGLAMVPQDLYDAAAIDGASGLARIRHVGLPYIRYVLLTGLLLQLTNTLATFDMIYMMTRGGPQDSTLTLFYYSYREAFQSGLFNFGYGAVLAQLGFLSCIVFYAYYLRLYKFEER